MANQSYASKSQLISIMQDAASKVKNAIPSSTSFTADRFLVSDANGAISASSISSTVDTTPTSGSNNLITSGGVYSYIDTQTNNILNASY